MAKEVDCRHTHCGKRYYFHSGLRLQKSLFSAHNYCMLAIAKVFTIGNSQAVRLPNAYGVDTRELWISKNAATGEITLRPKPTTDTLQALLTELQQLPTTPEFIPQRNDSAHKNWTF